MKSDTKIKAIFIINLLLVLAIASGALPRSAAFISLAIFTIFALWASAQDAICLFAASIPFFIALPINASFDNFNIWRIVIAIIFLKWFLGRFSLKQKTELNEIKTFFNNNVVIALAFCLAIISLLSIVNSYDAISSAKRIIYFANLSLPVFIIADLMRKNPGFYKIVLKYFLMGATALAIIGLFQLVSAFLFPFWTFHILWAKMVSLAFYGKNWSDIAFSANTWYSYSGNALRLRIFSTFPDSHSFPIYMIVAWSAWLILKSQSIRNEWKYLFTADFAQLFLLSFSIIMSQTRGIWLALIIPISLFAYLWLTKKISAFDAKKISAVFLIFIVVFLISYLILFIPQFKVADSSADGSSLIERLLSISDINETSNFSRIYIWSETLKSIAKNPLLGVGIGNYPVVLSQGVKLAKAGSSAHNLYLTVAAEIGIIGGILFALLVLLTLKYCLDIFKKGEGQYRMAGLYILFGLIWIYAYSLTDAALFDERAFLTMILIWPTVISLHKLLAKPNK